MIVKNGFSSCQQAASVFELGTQDKMLFVSTLLDIDRAGNVICVHFCLSDRRFRKLKNETLVQWEVHHIVNVGNT